MRIISGIHKGRKINAPKKLPVRPTTDMAKESLFNILRNSFTFSQVDVLDLYSGTGNISYEFASRGAASIQAVDQHSRCVRFIDQTAEQLDMPINTLKSDVLNYLEHCADQFDIIFADPPYSMDLKLFNKIVTLILDRKLLKEDGILVIEHSKHTRLEPHGAHLETRNYGGSSFSFFG